MIFVLCQFENDIVQTSNTKRFKPESYKKRESLKNDHCRFSVSHESLRPRSLSPRSLISEVHILTPWSVFNFYIPANPTSLSKSTRKSSFPSFPPSPPLPPSPLPPFSPDPSNLFLPPHFSVFGGYHCRATSKIWPYDGITSDLHYQIIEEVVPSCQRRCDVEVILVFEMKR